MFKICLNVYQYEYFGARRKKKEYIEILKKNRLIF